MGGQFKENWKRLANKLPPNNNSRDNSDIVRFTDESKLTTNASGIAGFPIVGVPSSGDVFEFNGTQWSPAVLPSAGSNIVTGVYAGDDANNRLIITGLTTIQDLRIDAEEDRGDGSFAHWTTFKNAAMEGKLGFFASNGSTGDRILEIVLGSGNFTVDGGNMNLAPFGMTTWRYFWTAKGT